MAKTKARRSTTPPSKQACAGQVAAAVGLVLLIVALYWRTTSFGFINYDDGPYVSNNEHVAGGLGIAGFRWAFVSSECSNWHPVTWISHMLDVELFGMRPGAFHGVNILLHVLNTLLLLAVLHRATGAYWRSLLVAALFAVHPLHVESVAWIAERKDVLSTAFWLLTTLAYMRYVVRPAVGRYLGVFALFSLGLMSKQMLVTMPLVLLLMDWWPLRRLRGDDGGAAIYLPVLWRRIQEKLPLAAVAVVLAVVAIVVQRSGGSVADLETLPLPIRIENALISYVRYPWMAVFPIGLGVFYPHQLVHYPLWMVAGSVVVLAACTWGTFVLRNRHPYLVFGWVWYLVTLSPVAGIIQVGAQSHADRYTYVPLIGLFVAGIWGLSALAEKLRLNPVLSWCGATAMVAALSVATWLQVGYWRDSETLFRRTIEVTRENPIAENNLGLALAEMGRNREAIVHFENSVRIQPKRYQPQYNLGKAYAAEGRTAEAVDHFAAAVRQRSDCAEAHYAWAIMLLKQENYAEAVVHFSESLKGRLAPEFAAGAHLNCGVFQANQGKMDDAIAHFREAVRLQPDSFAGYRNLAMALAAQNRVGEAETCLHAALQRWPGNTDLAAIRDSLRATKR